MGNVLSEEKKQQIVGLGRIGWSLRRIERETGIQLVTVSRNLLEAGVAVKKAGRPARNGNPAISATEVTPTLHPISKPANTVTPARRRKAGRQSRAPAPVNPSGTASKKPSRAAATPRPSGRIWSTITASPAATKASNASCANTPAPSRPTPVPSSSHRPARKVDGTGPLVRDPQSGKYRRTRMFVFTLGFSRTSVRLLRFQSSARIWAELHEKAFRRLGGTPKVLVLDNLGEGVIKADFYDPTLNPIYRDVLAHYGAYALPCRVNDPDRKGKVESGVGHAKKTPLKGQRFESIEQAQAYLDRWEDHWADTRIHGTTKRQVAAMFAEEKPTLQPLPLEPFRYYQFGERRVHLDGCVEVEAAYYSAPPRWIGRAVHVQWNDRFVRLLDPMNGQLLREHLRQSRGTHRIHDEDRSKRTPLSTQQLLARAGKAGPSVGAFCQTLLDIDGQAAIRPIQGVMAMAKRYGAATTEEACKLALEMGVYQYRFVRRYLEKHGPLTNALKQADPIIRQLDLYRDIVAKRTQENPE